jgi:hypothetical protein
MGVVHIQLGTLQKALELYKMALEIELKCYGGGSCQRGHDTWQHGTSAQRFRAESANNNKKQPSTQDLSG